MRTRRGRGGRRRWRKIGTRSGRGGKRGGIIIYFRARDYIYGDDLE
jgi:hypothetical protein